MAKNNAVEPVKTFVVDMPLDGPALGFDPTADTFSWRDILTSNYWNLDLLEEKVQSLGGNPVLTPARIVIKPVPNPEEPKEKQDMSPQIVLEFVENVPALVFNKTRAGIASRLTGTRNPALWGERLPKLLELYVGAERDMSDSLQVLFKAAPTVGNGSAYAGKNGSGSGNREDGPLPNSERGLGNADGLNDDLFG